MPDSLFYSRPFVVATKHHKERVISPILEQAFSMHGSVEPIDTDKYGTFTREQKRIDDMRTTARKKALEAAERTGIEIAIASEGSFQPHRSTPFIHENTELVLLIDTKNDIEIVGHHIATEAHVYSAEITSVEEIADIAKEWDFPNHGIIVRKSRSSIQHIAKECRTIHALESEVKKRLHNPLRKKVVLETDMRADRNPTRMNAIQEATKNLIIQMNTTCPECAFPGFSITDMRALGKCALCNTATDIPTHAVRTCQQCKYSKTTALPEYSNGVDPTWCDRCNP